MPFVPLPFAIALFLLYNKTNTVLTCIPTYFQREVLDRGERRAMESAREEEHDTGQETDVDPKVLRKLKDTIVQRDNEISILVNN